MWIDHTRWARNTWAMAAIFILTMADIMDMVSFSALPTDANANAKKNSMGIWIYSLIEIIFL